jgi:sugar diacid utilization regulator
MQFSSRGIILDQLQQAYAATSGESIPVSEIDAKLTLLDTTLRELLPTSALVHIARTLVDATRQRLDMDLCALALTSDEDGHLTMQAASPDLNGQLRATPPLHIEAAIWEKLFATAGTLPDLSACERDQLNPLKNVQYESLHIVPLAVGKECIGLLYCYSSKARDPNTFEQLILQTISTFAAISIMNRRLLDAAASTISIKSFFDDLLSGDAALEDSLRSRAIALGWNCTSQHVMLMVEIGRAIDGSEPSEPGESRHAIKLVEQRLQAQYSGSLFDEREHRLYAMVALAQDASAPDLKKWLDTLLQQVESELRVSLFAGISNACHDLRDYAGGFSEAQEALTITRCLNTGAACMQFRDLGAYRYLYPFARDHTRHDLYLEQVAIIARYDSAHKRAGLLSTLEVYLEHCGNIKEVSELLDVHRNTVTQRLERIKSLCAIDLAQYSNWLPLQMAIKIHQLRQF